MTSGLRADLTNQYSPEEERQLVRMFIRRVLQAFVSSSEFASSRFNITTGTEAANPSWDAFFAQQRNPGASMLLELNLKQLYKLHSVCIEGVADQLASLLLPENCIRQSNTRTRISTALSDNSEIGGGHVRLTIPDAFRVLQDAASKFRSQVRVADDGTDRWCPDWRTQMLVWGLIKKLGQIRPPQILQAPYQELKEAAFACLFESDFIDKQWERCSFRSTLLRYIPRPYSWDADLSWLSLSIFVSFPLTSFVQILHFTYRKNEEVLSRGIFWTLFISIFCATAVGMILFYSAYRSRYATRLMQKSSVGTPYEERFMTHHAADTLRSKTGNGAASGGSSSDSLDAMDLESADSIRAPRYPSPVAHMPSPALSLARTDASANPAASAPALPSSAQPMPVTDRATERRHSMDEGYFDFPDHVPSRPNDELPSMAPGRAIGFDDRSGATLQLYQASMFVRRIYGSTYFDESWTFGLSEEQVCSAVKVMLTSDSVLGRQYAAFSFAAIAVASRGVPPVGEVAARAVVGAAQTAAQKALVQATLDQFNFGIFSFLGALAFVSGLTSAVLADLILRQMSFTEISREGTAHGFVQRFGFFIRVVGGVNSSAGMFLSTAVLHFLISIFKVSPFAVMLLGATWLILGTMVSESFFSNFHFWRMSEILDDVNHISEPDVRSPSPLTGALQFVMTQFRKAGNGMFSKRAKTREETL